MSQEKDQLVSTPAREWMRANGYAPVKTEGVVAVRKNTNGYPFITLKKQGTPEGEGGLNIYFSKSSAVAAGDVITSEMSADLIVVETKNEAGEDRLKLHYADLF